MRPSQEPYMYCSEAAHMCAACGWRMRHPQSIH
jgi:hypothetical protein